MVKEQEFKALGIRVSLQDWQFFYDEGVSKFPFYDITKALSRHCSEGLEINPELRRFVANHVGGYTGQIVTKEPREQHVHSVYSSNRIVVRAHEEAHALKYLVGDMPLRHEAQRVFGLRSLPLLSRQGQECYAHRGSVIALVKRGYTLKEALDQLESLGAILDEEARQTVAEPFMTKKR